MVLPLLNSTVVVYYGVLAIVACTGIVRETRLQSKSRAKVYYIQEVVGGATHPLLAVHVTAIHRELSEPA
jgi:hypothetical protein